MLWFKREREHCTADRVCDESVQIYKTIYGVMCRGVCAM